MSDNTDNLVTMKIRSSAHSWVKDEQNRIRVAEGKEPSQAEIFDRMRDLYERFMSGVTPVPAPVLDRWQKMLSDIRERGDRAAVSMIEQQLQFLHRNISPVAGGAPGRAKGAIEREGRKS